MSRISRVGLNFIIGSKSFQVHSEGTNPKPDGGVAARRSLRMFKNRPSMERLHAMISRLPSILISITSFEKARREWPGTLFEATPRGHPDFGGYREGILWPIIPHPYIRASDPVRTELFSKNLANLCIRRCIGLLRPLPRVHSPTHPLEPAPRRYLDRSPIELPP